MYRVEIDFDDFSIPNEKVVGSEDELRSYLERTPGMLGFEHNGTMTITVTKTDTDHPTLFTD